MSAIDRLAPQNREAEEAVLGSLLIDPDAIFEVTNFLRPDAFYSQANRWAYEAILSLHARNEPLDSLTLIEELRRREKLEEIGGEPYVIGLVSAVPTSINARAYAKIVEAAAIRRDLIHAASQIANLAYDEDEDINVIIDRSEQRLFAISEQRTTRDLVPIRQIAEEYTNRIEDLHKRDQEIVGVPTGYTDIDRLLGGLNRSDLIILAARPGMGKCVTGDTKLVNPNTGELVTIETLVEQKSPFLLTLDKNYKLRPGVASHFINNGVKPVYLVQTALGREIKTTFSHPFLTISGWKPLHQLQVGERVAVPRVVPVFGQNHAPDHEAKLLGYLLADGCLVSNSPQFTNINPRLREDFIEAALQFPGNKVKTIDYQGQRTPTVYVFQDKEYLSIYRESFPETLNNILKEKAWSISHFAGLLDIKYDTVSQWCSGVNFPSAPSFYRLCEVLGISEYTLLPLGHAEASQTNNALTDWLKKQGVWGKSAAEKEIPAGVFSYTRPQLALFLNRLFACDGSVYIQNGRQPGISYSSISKSLITGVRHLLLRFGILAKLRTRHINYQNEKRVAYELRVTHTPSLAIFVQEIGALGKEAACQAVAEYCQRVVSNNNLDTIPHEIWTTIMELKQEQSWASVTEKMGLGRGYNLHVGQRSPGRERLHQLAEALQDETLTNLAQSDVYWDEITAIEPLGQQQVYDLTVPETHNFVANDMIVHNTSFQNGIALTAARTHGKRVAIFNLEMSGEQLVQRMLAAETRIDIQRLRRGQLADHEWSIFYEAVHRLSETRIFIDDSPTVTPMQLRTKCRRLYAEHGLDLVMIDYLQLMQADRSTNNRVQEIADISRGLKQLARELDVPVVAAAQLSRAVESRQDKRPMLSDLRDSGSIEQDADIVMFIYRDEYYNPDTTDRPGIAEINVAKHRNGPTASVDLYWNGELASFNNLQKREAMQAGPDINIT